jgi:hypothetical protein
LPFDDTAWIGEEWYPRLRKLIAAAAEMSRSEEYEVEDEDVEVVEKAAPS